MSRRMWGTWSRNCVFILTVLLIFAMSNLASSGKRLVSIDFEIFGRVQGVCFRMYTEDEGRKLGVSGWVKNTRQGTVTGQVQGPEEKVYAM
ncbi:acylphosphatase-2-like isoform X3 [Polypterus senegalus]|nr:acylphosphatase-2-like isoform X3 [Polypterus senegalus]